MKDTLRYFDIRPYRYSARKAGETSTLVSLMEKRFPIGFDNYWHQFGYEIAGPVCYTFTKWLSETIKKHPDITGIAFVARDGWLLKEIYDLIPSASCKTAYVYASRLLESLYREDPGKTEYRRYFNSLDFGNGSIAIVDTVTTSFSSYKLISRVTNAPVYGFYWAALLGTQQRADNFTAFQNGTNTIRCWNLMEFIMTSPEPPIIGLNGLEPIYLDASPYELKREALFAQIEKGALEFAKDIVKENPGNVFSNRTITQWVNSFLKHPADVDVAAFDDILFSESTDHSDIIYLDPFGKKTDGLNYQRLRDRVWMVSMQHPKLYKIVHAGNIVRKKALSLLYSFKTKKYNGSNTNDLVEELSRYDIVSFDIFDTLLLRSCKSPSDVFGIVEKKLGFADFKNRRIKAEEEARLRPDVNNHEITIYDIYDQLALDSEGESISFQHEIDVEYDVCYANPVFLELYYKLLKKHCIMIATSDMYIPETILQNLLHEKGFNQISRVFVSCDYGFGKRHGELQKAIQKELGTDLRYIHIGDNLLSDVRGSIAAGWNAILYKAR